MVDKNKGLHRLKRELKKQRFIRTIKKYRRVLMAALTFLLLAIITFLIYMSYSNHLNWTGFSNKTLWDWLQLLIVPAVLAVVGLIYNFTVSNNEQKIADQRYKQDAKRTEEQQNEDLLQSFIDKISELITDQNLCDVNAKPEIKYIARARTLTVLSRLDGHRKASVIQFLHETGLVRASKFGTILSLEGADMSWSTIRFINLNNIDLRKVYFHGADLQGTKLRGADLRETILEGVDLGDVDLSEANLSEATLSDAQLWDTNLQKANLQGASLRNANLSGADLRNANLVCADLSNAKFMYRSENPRAVSEPAILSGANLMGANLSGADLRNIDLTDTILENADFSSANLSGANLSGVDLRKVKLANAVLDNANLLGAKRNQI